MRDLKALERRSSVSIFDPSECYRPENNDRVEDVKDEKAFRVYSEDDTDPWAAVVKKTYLQMHTNQTVDFVKEKMEKWTKFDHFESTILEALDTLNELIDESDGDLQLPNIVHAFQTAERLRRDYPEHDWLHLTGLIHDLGKVMAVYGEPQWAVVGDTLPVGCKPQPSVVFVNSSFHNNPDMKDERYNTDLGMYKEGCGLRRVTMSWGHDEYLYRVLTHNKSTLPEQALYIIRFHSFYPLHSGGDYQFLLDDHDKQMLTWVKLFQKYDLYTKSDDEADLPDIEALKPYYQQLIDKYCPGILKF